jgi:hypothetical protein
MVINCFSQVARGGFLVLATPLLLTGSLFHHLGHRLAQNGIRNAEYATAEWTAAAGLEEMASESIEQAQEDQAVVAELEADVTRNGEMAGVNEASAGEDATVVGEDEAAAASEAGTAAVVQEVPGVNVAADATEGAAIVGEEASAVAAAGGFLKSEGLAIEEGGQSAADENEAAEKEVEAQSLNAAAGTEEAASVGAKQQATRASLLAGGFFLEAGMCQLLSMLVETPVALVLFAKWGTSAIAGPCGAVCTLSGGSAGHATMLSWIASRLSLTASIMALLAAPWASTVLVASDDAGSIASRMAGLVPHPAHARLLLEAKHAKPLFLKGFNPFARPNTATTTVNPTTLPAPHEEGRWGMLMAALHMTIEPMLRWGWPVLVDVALISVTFAAVTLAVSVGRHGPAAKKGTLRHGTISAASREAIAYWLWGLMLLIAVWVLSILLAKELRPIAQHLQSAHIGGPTCFLLILLSFAAHIFHGYMQHGDSDDEDEDILGNEDGHHTEDLEGGTMGVGVVSIACAATATIAEMTLQAAEGPINAWAVGGAYQSFLLCKAVVFVTPWHDLMAPWLHSVPPVLLWISVAVVLACCGGILLAIGNVCRRLTRSAAREYYEQYDDHRLECRDAAE